MGEESLPGLKMDYFYQRWSSPETEQILREANVNYNYESLFDEEKCSLEILNKMLAFDIYDDYLGRWALQGDISQQLICCQCCGLYNHVLCDLSYIRELCARRNQYAYEIGELLKMGAAPTELPFQPDTDYHCIRCRTSPVNVTANMSITET